MTIHVQKIAESTDLSRFTISAHSWERAARWIVSEARAFFLVIITWLSIYTGFIQLRKFYWIQKIIILYICTVSAVFKGTLHIHFLIWFFFLTSPCGRESRYCYLQMTDEGPVAQVPVNPAQGFTTTKWLGLEPWRFDAGLELLLLI